MASGRTFLLLAIALLAAPPSPAAEDPPPPPAGESPELQAIRQELQDAYLRVEKDFEALTGPNSDGTLAALAKTVEDALRTRGDAAEGAIPGLWMEAGLLGPEVAARLSARRLEAAAKARAEGREETAAATLAAAAKLVFPEATMADNWDRHFLDLDVVRRWVKAKSGGDAPGEETPPEKPAPPAVPDPSDMVLIPRGEFAVPDQRGRGWPNPGQKAEKRTVKAFHIDRAEVCCAAYAAFLHEVKDAGLRERILPTGWKADDRAGPGFPAGADLLPVTGIPYEGAAAFAAYHGKRLPSEDEWERAARGDEGFKYPWGNEWMEGRAVVGGLAGPAPVGSSPGDASPFLVLDLCGNVSELCATQPDGKPVKGIPKATDQVVRRGGNFKESAEEAANDWRYVNGGTTRSPQVGFRCAMDEREYEKKFGKR